jgi:hypothetical protein
MNLVEKMSALRFSVNHLDIEMESIGSPDQTVISDRAGD